MKVKIINKDHPCYLEIGTAVKETSELSYAVLYDKVLFEGKPLTELVLKKDLEII